MTIEFTVSVAPATLDHYRLDWAPADGVELAGMWAPAVVTDKEGRDYLGLRGWSDYIVGMTHTVSPFCGFRALTRKLDGDPPHLFPQFATHDWFEPIRYSESAEKITFAYDSGRLVRDAAGLHWYDADGRWEMHGETVSDVFVVHVPAQEGVSHEVYYRHELLTVRGTIDGNAVEGCWHQDFAYGPPGMTYTELPIARHLEGMWVSWIHEYDDGEIGGGCFWQGRGELAFGPGYLLRQGATTAHKDIEATLGFTDDGAPNAMHVNIAGHTYDFVLDTIASPLHFKGRLVSDSSGKETSRSWCWIEYAEVLMSPEILDAVGSKFDLVRGRR